jgi:hypothetical protein
MVKDKTDKQLIDDLKEGLVKLETKVDYEAIAEIKRLQGDVKELGKRYDKYATIEALAVVAEKINNISKAITWVITLVLGAVIMAVLQSVFRTNK